MKYFQFFLTVVRTDRFISRPHFGIFPINQSSEYSLCVSFPESTAVAHSGPLDPEDDDSELPIMRTLEVSDDEMSTDGDAMMETKTKDAEQPREPMRSD